MKEVTELILSNIIQILTIASTFIASGGLAAIIKYRKDQNDLKRDVAEMKRLICYRKNCPDRLINDCNEQKDNENGKF